MAGVTGTLLRRVLLPLLAVGLVVITLTRGTATDTALPAADPAPAASAPLVEDPFSAGLSIEQAELLLDLWRSWGPDLMSASDTGPDLPDELTALAYEEAAYVLISVRAAQIAAAGADGGFTEGHSDVLARSGLSPDPPQVVTAPVAGRAECISVRWRDEPYGRTFYGLTTVSDEPGPEPLTALEGVLLRTVRVGLGDADDATCGAGGVAFSPAAQRALAALAPQLLPH
jgi:hypothetical protein